VKYEALAKKYKDTLSDDDDPAVERHRTTLKALRKNIEALSHSELYVEENLANMFNKTLRELAAVSGENLSPYHISHHDTFSRRPQYHVPEFLTRIDSVLGLFGEPL
jgi:hypothetical protein